MHAAVDRKDNKLPQTSHEPQITACTELRTTWEDQKVRSNNNKISLKKKSLELATWIHFRSFDLLTASVTVLLSN